MLRVPHKICVDTFIGRRYKRGMETTTWKATHEITMPDGAVTLLMLMPGSGDAWTEDEWQRRNDVRPSGGRWHRWFLCDLGYWICSGDETLPHLPAHTDGMRVRALDGGPRYRIFGEAEDVLEATENVLFGNPRATDWPTMRAYLQDTGNPVDADADAVCSAGEVIDALIAQYGAESIIESAQNADCARILAVMSDSYDTATVRQ